MRLARSRGNWRPGRAGCTLEEVRWTPETLAEAAGGSLRRRGGRPIETAFIDSRVPVRNGLFVPIVAVRDGHDFIPSAIAGGASAVLVETGRTFPTQGDLTVIEVDDTLEAFTSVARDARRRCSGPVVAITGSNGKTTTRAMTAAVLAAGGFQVLHTRGNLNNHLGVPLTLCARPHEPDAMVIELGMNASGENDHLGSIVTPDLAIITSVALEHVEFLGSLAAIAQAEAETIRHIRPGGAVVVPGDEPLLRPHWPADRDVITFGSHEGDSVQILSVGLGSRTRCRWRFGDGVELEAALQPFGEHNARNAAAALAVGHRLGIAANTMAMALESVAPVGDRGRVVEHDGRLIIADCYNANPGSMEAALRSLAGLRGPQFGPRVAVLGDMRELGSRGDELHAEVGRLAARLGLDAVVGFGPLSRRLVEAARAGGVEALHVEDDVDAAADFVRRYAGAAVLVKASRGTRLERVVDRLTSS